MVEIKGIYAASVSVLNDDMSLNIKKTANHCEKIIKLVLFLFPDVQDFLYRI